MAFTGQLGVASSQLGSLELGAGAPGASVDLPVATVDAAGLTFQNSSPLTITFALATVDVAGLAFANNSEDATQALPLATVDIAGVTFVVLFPQVLPLGTVTVAGLTPAFRADGTLALPVGLVTSGGLVPTPHATAYSTTVQLPCATVAVEGRRPRLVSPAVVAAMSSNPMRIG